MRMNFCRKRTIAFCDSQALLGPALARLKPRERDALWLAYAEGLSHQEIAETLGVKTTSMKILLFRARQKLASLLRGAQ